jgi:hypothetical protein
LQRRANADGVRALIRFAPEEIRQEVLMNVDGA